MTDDRERLERDLDEVLGLVVPESLMNYWRDYDLDEDTWLSKLANALTPGLLKRGWRRQRASVEECPDAGHPHHGESCSLCQPVERP